MSLNYKRPISTHRNLGRFLVDSDPSLWLLFESILAALFFAFFSSFGKGVYFPETQDLLKLGSVLYGLSFGIIGLGLGLFEKENRFNRLRSLQLISLNTLFSALAGLFLVYVTSFEKVGRWSLALGSIGASTLIYLLVHYTGAFLLLKFPHRFIIIGKASEVGQKILSEIRIPHAIQFQHADELVEAIQEEIESTKEMSSVVYKLRNEGVSDIVIGWGAQNTAAQTEFLFEALRQGLRIVDDVKYFTSITRRLPLEGLPASYVLKMGFDIHKPLSGFAKRLFDIFFALFLLVALSPIFILVSIAIVIESGFPIIYKQKRFGRFGKLFSVYKFRSMKKDISGPDFTRPNDTRITMVGKFIRKAHIDEFPQLINILGGSMSFVGPRPEASEIVTKLSKELPLIHLRHIVRPGLTGHAQISQGKTEDSPEDIQRKLSFDLYYIRNYSFYLDLSILLKTLSRLLDATW